MCILIVAHQFNRMFPLCSWECMLSGRCSPGKRCHTFWNRNIVLLPILLGIVSCVPKFLREGELEYLVDSVANQQTKSIWLVALTTAVSPRGNRVVRLANKENGSCTTCHLGTVAHTSSTGLATHGNPKITPGEARMIGNHGSNAKTQTVIYNTQSRK